MAVPDKLGTHTSAQYDDGQWSQQTIPTTHPGPVERRIFLIDTALTDIATDKAAVATGELRTYTFSAALDYRYLEMVFIADNTGTASDVMAVAYTLNAPNVTVAASRLSVSETDADAIGDYMYRGETVVIGTNEAITRIDLTGITGSGGEVLAEDMVVIRVW